MAKRDKLTQRQKKQIGKNQRGRALPDKDVDRDVKKLGDLGELRKGCIISRFGEQADVLDIKSGKVSRCFLRQHLGSPVPGDRVSFRSTTNQHGVIESMEERQSLLQRPSQHQGLKPVVANVNHAFVVVAPLPDFSTVLLDRYLIAIENAELNITIVANKWDLTNEIEKQSIEQHLAKYEALGYPVLRVSTKVNMGKGEFQHAISGHASILVGQSGVGKSSIINWLFPSTELLTQAISENSRLGQHTTTASQLFFLSDDYCTGGFIIDSPGIREFGLWHLDRDQIASGFCEFRDYIGSCKFRDCLHKNEPGCEILKAVENNRISKERWQNYKKILANNDL